MFNFVIDCTDADLASYKSLSPDEYVRVFTRGDLNWCLQTYLILSKQKKLSVQCSNHLIKGCINIIHSDQLLRLKGNADTFMVCVRADYPSRPWAHYHLVQNGYQKAANTSYIPHWVQPGLIKRDPTRRKLHRVAYAGAPVKGNMAGTIDEWKRLFEPYNLDFIQLPSGCWHDLSTIDVLIGIRGFNTKAYHTKPPTKLFNAWHANIPFIGGYDSAFREVGKPGEDYLLARSPQEALKAVLSLRDEPALYAKLVLNGQRNARQFTEATIAQRWEKVLSGPVMNRFVQWKSKPRYEELRFELKQRLGYLAHNAKQQIKKLLYQRKWGKLSSKPIPSEI